LVVSPNGPYPNWVRSQLVEFGSSS
jgi:hypothetical protein